MKVTRVDDEKTSAVRFIGKKYKNGSAWGQWWENGWFGVLENTDGLSPLNDNGYIGLMRSDNDGFEYWIGMFFLPDSEVPEDFDHLDIPKTEFAVFHIYGNEQKGEIYGEPPYKMCQEKLATDGLSQVTDCLRFERYNCPRYTTPDKDGNIILDYLIAVKK